MTNQEMRPARDSMLYFDHNATTSVDPRVLEAMLPYFTEKFGNSVSLTHAYGWEAETAAENARAHVAKFLNCDPKEFFFTSGATESNNWVIEGLIEQIRTTEPLGTRIHFLISPLEHNSVLRSAERAQRFFGVELDYLDVNSYGQVDLNKLVKKIKPHTRLIAAMWAQNEIGSINPIQELTQICREHKIYLLSDATQAIGKVPVDLTKTPVDFLSFSAHKLAGPKGVGFLFIRKKNPHIDIPALLCGGGHERGFRSGTLNTPGIVGLGKAFEIAQTEFKEETKKIAELRDLFFHELKKSFPNLRLNGHPLERTPNNLHVTFLNCEVPSTLKGLAASRGSACLSGQTTTSHVLKTLGFTEAEAAQSLRLSLGRTTTKEDVLKAAELLSKQVRAI